MKILFDQGVPLPLRQYLSEHSITTAYEKEWSELSNGDLLIKAKRDEYDLLITTDQNLQYQQNLSNRDIAIIVLLTTSWPQIRLHIEKIRSATNSTSPGSFTEISC